MLWGSFGVGGGFLKRRNRAWSHGGDRSILRSHQRSSVHIFEKGIVAHIPFAHPLSNGLRQHLIQACRDVGVKVHAQGTYVCMEGPMFSTLAESQFYRTLKADVIGMTNLQEAKLAREAEIDYATLALATDYDCWHPHHDSVTTEQILKVMAANIQNAQNILACAVKKYDFSKPAECDGILKNAIFTDRKKIPAATEEIAADCRQVFVNSLEKYVNYCCGLCSPAIRSAHLLVKSTKGLVVISSFRHRPVFLQNSIWWVWLAKIFPKSILPSCVRAISI